MSRSEKLILVQDLPEAIVDALDALLETQGYERVASRSISEDFTPLLNEAGGPLAFVLSLPRGEWVACWTSLDPDPESELAAAVAAALERPVVYLVLGGASGVNAYRYWESGNLHEEALPVDTSGPGLDEPAIMARLRQHGIAPELVDDRVAGFGDEHLLLGYVRRASET